MLATIVVSALGFCTGTSRRGDCLQLACQHCWCFRYFHVVGDCACHIRFRRAYLLQGYKLDDLPYRAPFFPLAPILAFVMCLIVLVGQNYEAVLAGNVWDAVSSYIGVPLFLGVWLGYHLVKKIA